tara:strand:- start:653 stop:1345 length:693 start_codon:yes stop_codon:yes gene_type:complete
MTDRTQLNVNISPELLKVLKQNAIKSGLTLAKYVTKLIQSYVSKEDLIEDENLINERINSMESQLIEISEKLNNFNKVISNTSFKEEKEKISDLIVSPRIATNPKKPSSADVKRIGILTAQHFKNIQREEVLSAKEAWKLFLDQEFTKLIEDKYLTGILDVFRGEKALTLEMMQGIGFKYGRCPVLADLRTMSDLPVKRELTQLVHEVELYIAHMANKQNKTFEVQPVDV